MVYFDQILKTYTIQHCLDTGMHNDDDASLSNILVGHGQLVKMLVTFKPNGISLSNFAYLYI